MDYLCDFYITEQLTLLHYYAPLAYRGWHQCAFAQVAVLVEMGPVAFEIWARVCISLGYFFRRFVTVGI